MAIKENIDFSSFTELGNFDLFSNSIRKAFSYDAYGDKKNFQAIVISQPLPLTPGDSQFFLGEETVRTAKVSQFSYRARILGADSPHKFLPDPCNPNYTGEINTTNEIIALHTTFYSAGEVGVDEVLPRIGSLVEVRLEKNAYSYDLSRGAHIKVVRNPSDPTATTDTCDTIEAIMAAADSAFSIGSLSDPQLRSYFGVGGPQDVENGKLPEELLKKSKHHKYAKFLVDVIDDYDNLHDAFKTHFGKDLILTDHYRTYSAQVKLKADKGKKAATPGTSNHGWGLAFDFDHRDSSYGIAGGKRDFQSDVYKWLKANAPTYSFHNPSWAQEGGSNPEPWHFESTKKSNFYSPPKKNETIAKGAIDGEADPTDTTATEAS